MEFFLDTGDIEEIKEAAQWGIVDGVTTNPTLIAKTKRDQKEVIHDIVTLIDGPISAEVISTDSEGMLREADILAEIHKNVVIKLPLTVEGIKACKTLSKREIKTNVTLCFSPNQALIAAKAGATYISPFIGRLDDNGHDGMALVEEIRTIYDNYGYTTQILAASLRHPTHVRDAALVGADVGTMPFNVLKALYSHPLTDKGLAQFLKDANAN
ncbi:MAG: fructose-6-phosphate aldolase [Halobacteriovoraceae bacterium]|nr:fructose-6-phosphate aldolase [Halobacteriovoraceae bacterium]